MGNYREVIKQRLETVFFAASEDRLQLSTISRLASTTVSLAVRAVHESARTAHFFVLPHTHTQTNTQPNHSTLAALTRTG